MKRKLSVGLVLLFIIMLAAGCGTIEEKGTTEKSGGTATQATVGASVGASVSADPFSRTYSKEELQADFNKLRNLIETVHPRLYADKEALARLLDENYTLVAEGMTELELLRVLSPIVSALNCGHTSISLSAAYQKQLGTRGKYFPLPLRFIGDKAYVDQNGFAPFMAIGSELLSINGKSIADIRTSLFRNLSSDGRNETHKQMLINGWFRYRYQNFLDSGSEYDITYRDQGSGAILSAKLNPVTNDEWASKNRQMWPEENPSPCGSAFEKGYAVLRMSSFYPEGGFSIDGYKKFIDAFFLEVKSKNVGNVILDVRDNGGGDPYVTSHLFNYLAKSSQPYFTKTVMDYYSGLKSPVPLAENRFTGNLFTLMNGGSFSSTGHLLALLKYQKVGAFIGEESGASFACTDASANYTLPNTGIQFRSSTLVWDVAVSGLTPGRGIMPDYEVVPTMKDYMDKRDAVMEKAIAMLPKN